MKNWLLALLLGCGLLNLACAQLVFEEETIEHEATLLEEKTEAVFRFTNVGQEAIEVLNVSSSCGCTVPQLDKRLYQPGETGEIRAVFTFGARIGKQHKRITVNTEGSGQKAYQLNMITIIPEWVKVQPRVLRWKSTAPVESQALLVEVAQPKEISLALPSESEIFDVAMQEEGAGKFTLMVTPKSVEKRVTEFLKFTATVTVDGQKKTREFGVHCLIR